MTDALSEWFVKHFDRNDESGALNSLLSMDSQEDFESFVRSMRDVEAINDDDTSMIVVRLEADDVCPELQSDQESELPEQADPQDTHDTDPLQADESGMPDGNVPETDDLQPDMCPAKHLPAKHRPGIIERFFNILNKDNNGDKTENSRD
ncbi:MAG: hypothetical protein K2F79_02590 [Muribaculaceae bacterium]|nr:hypothetical protein [Muribaculaceae bacterium]